MCTKLYYCPMTFGPSFVLVTDYHLDLRDICPEHQFVYSYSQIDSVMEIVIKRFDEVSMHEM